MTQPIDIRELRELWDDGWSAADLAERYNVTRRHIHWQAEKHKFPKRGRQDYQEPTPEDAAASEDSLALSPWVRARIAELGLQGRREESAVGLVQTRLIVGGRSCSVI
jgi:hypothetical protein